MSKISRLINKLSISVVSKRRQIFGKKILILVSICSFMLLTSFAVSGQKIAATRLTGKWHKGADEIKILALDGQKLKVEYSGIYEYKYQGDPIANLGEAKGIAVIKGDTAIFQDSKDANCRMIMKFTGGKLEIESDGCTFGKHVNASGTYQRISIRKPKFNW